MILETITPLIITFNEEPNLDRTLQKLTWAERIIIIDSFSTDMTLEIAKNYPQVKLFQRSFDTFAQQCNYGLSKISTEWTLSLDADYLLSDILIKELINLEESWVNYGYSVPFKYCVVGKPLRDTLLPPRTVLYRTGSAHYQEDGHAHRVQVQGKIVRLSGHIYHDDRKSLSRWLWAQDRYMIIESKKLLETLEKDLSWGDRIRKQKILAPIIIFFYCLILKGGVFDGWRGWYYAFQRVFAEILLSLHLVEAELSNAANRSHKPRLHKPRSHKPRSHKH